MNPATNLKIVDTAPADPFASLRAERDALGKRMAEINTELRGLPAPDANALDAVVSSIAALGTAELAQLKALDESERNAMAAWLATGAVGSAPTADMEKRKVLNVRLSEAMKLAATMQTASAALLNQQREVNAKYAAITEQLYHAAVTEIVRRFETEYGDILNSADAIRQRLANAYAAIEFLRNSAGQHESRGQTNRMNAIRQSIQRLEQLPRPVFFPTSRKPVFDAIPTWAQAFEALLK